MGHSESCFMLFGLMVVHTELVQVLQCRDQKTKKDVAWHPSVSL